MKFVPSTIGGNQKQYAILGGLVVLLVVVYLMNRSDSVPAGPAPAAAQSSSPSSPTIPAPANTPLRQTQPAPATGPRGTSRGGVRSVKDFRPSIKPEEGVDLSRIDPRIDLGLLAKVQNVPLEGGSPRNIFAFGAPPPPPPPPVKPIKPGMTADGKPITTAPSPITPTMAPAPPPPPPIPLKFYGYVNRSSGTARQAFFLDGDEIQIKSENDVIRNRYKIIRIGINSAVVEDLSNHNQQTLPLAEEANG